MTNYQHGWKAVDPEEGKKYRVTFPEKHKADAGSIISWKIYTVKTLVYPLKIQLFYEPFTIDEPTHIIFEEHPDTVYEYRIFTFYPVVDNL